MTEFTEILNESKKVRITTMKKVYEAQEGDLYVYMIQLNRFGDKDFIKIRLSEEDLLKSLTMDEEDMSDEDYDRFVVGVPSFIRYTASSWDNGVKNLISKIQSGSYPIGIDGEEGAVGIAQTPNEAKQSAVNAFLQIEDEDW